MKKRMHIYIGTFSDDFFSVYIDCETLEAEDLHPIHDPAGRSAMLALSADGKTLYTANEYMNGEGGMAAFRLTEGGDPVFLNSVSSHTQGPADNTTMSAYGREYVLGSGFFEGDVMVCPVADDGSLLPMSDHFILREGAHAHGVRACPGTNLVILPDTMHGMIDTWEMTPEGRLSRKAVFQKEGMAAPRHVEFSKNGKQLFILTERTSTLEVFDINRETGELTHTAHFSNLPDDFHGESSSAAIHRSPDGRFLYLSNRGHDSITVYRTREDGGVTRMGWQTTAICWPREFLIAPDGSFMLVGNQNSSSVSAFRINRETGMPEYVNSFSMPEAPVSFIHVREK